MKNQDVQVECQDQQNVHILAVLLSKVALGVCYRLGDLLVSLMPAGMSVFRLSEVSDNSESLTLPLSHCSLFFRRCICS